MRSSVASWVEATFGEVVEILFEVAHLSVVTGVRVADGRALVVKERGLPDRARACVAWQAALHDDGFPCPAVLGAVVDIDGMAVHAEAYVPGRRHVGRAEQGDAEASAALLADLVRRTRRLRGLPSPHPPPMWLAWDHGGPDTWPAVEEPPPHPDAMATENWLTELAERARRRLLHADLGAVIVAHGDWEAQNMAVRTTDGVLVVHDWDSLATRPEATFVGAAAATFASGAEQPTVTPVDVTEHFIDSYQREAGRWFTSAEVEAAWAAGVWLAAHNARMELLYGRPRLIHAQLSADGLERIRRAGA